MVNDKAGNPHTSIEAMKKVVTDFYKDLFTSSRGPISLHKIDTIDTRVDDNMAAELSKFLLKMKLCKPLKKCSPANPSVQMDYLLCFTKDYGILSVRIFVL